jgi:hypothetical protein
VVAPDAPPEGAEAQAAGTTARAAASAQRRAVPKATEVGVTGAPCD